MSSIEPDDAGCQVDGGQKVRGTLVVARRDRPKLLELGEEILNQVTRLVQILVIGTLVPTVGLGRDHRRLAGLFQRGKDPCLGVERLVGDQDVGLESGKQGVRSLQVVRLPRREREAGRVAECLDGGVDLGAQAAPAAPDGFITAVFFAAPALC